MNEYIQELENLLYQVRLTADEQQRAVLKLEEAMKSFEKTVNETICQKH